MADAYPNFSICGIPYYISGEVAHWQDLAHRSYADLEATGMQLRLDTDGDRHRRRGHQVWLRNPDGSEEPLAYDRLVVGTGAVPVRPPDRRPGTAPTALGEADGVHLLHTMGDTFSLQRTLDEQGAGHGAHRRGRLRRAGDGRGPGHSERPAGGPGGDAARGSAHRRPRARGAGAGRARRPRGRGLHFDDRTQRGSCSRGERRAD